MKNKKITISEEPRVKIDKRLNKYDNKVLFPKKLEKANKMLKEVGIPKEILSL